MLATSSAEFPETILLPPSSSRPDYEEVGMSGIPGEKKSTV